MFQVPGRADDVGDELLQRWNERIAAEYDRLAEPFGSRFFSLDPAEVSGGDPVPVAWFADPAEPAFCLGEEAAAALSDWGTRGRHELHNEYCEFAAIYAEDDQGRPRLKRVQVTTELREYWVELARHDPELVRDLASTSLGRSLSLADLYGPGPDPAGLAPDAREARFARWTAGSGRGTQPGAPAQPLGGVNTGQALFMTHPINGLDDLLYIVMFGAQPYASTAASGQPSPATREAIFRSAGVEHLACRHADPAAAMAAAGAAFEGRAVAFADPLGMYIQSFASDVFSLDDGPVPEAWIRFGRGVEGLRQRLEFGPGDDEPRFLDEALVSVGAVDTPVTGGYQVVKQVEVGPFVVVGPPSAVGEDEYRLVDVDPEPIDCQSASVCEQIRRLHEEFRRPMRRTAPRTLTRG